jgi:predicted DNA-binding protein with PD1-like motif
MRALQAFQTGRRFLAPLTPGRDLLGELADFCRAAKLNAALLTVTGSVRSGTIGTFDPDQEVYVTHSVERPLEIAACHGTVTPGDDPPCLRAGIVLADATGQVLAGRLLSPTIVLMAEATLDEMVGEDSRVPGDACRRFASRGGPQNSDTPASGTPGSD